MDTFLINFANRQGFYGSGFFLFENDAIDPIAEKITASSHGPLMDMFRLLAVTNYGITSRFSVAEQIQNVMSGVLLSNCEMTLDGITTRSECITRHFDSVTKLSEAILESLQYDVKEWEIFVLEQLFHQLRIIEQKYEETCLDYDETIQKGQQWHNNRDLVELNKTINVKNVSKHVETLAKDVRLLETQLQEAESQSNIYRLEHEKLLQQLALHRKALSLIHSQEKSSIITDVLSFEPQVLSWNTVELLFPNKLRNTFDISACLHWNLLELSSVDAGMDSSYSSSSILNTTIEQVLGTPLVTYSSQVAGETVFSSTSCNLMKSLFGVRCDDNSFWWPKILLEMVGLLEEKRSADLSDAVLTASNLFFSVQMLDYDVSETEHAFQCKASVVLPPLGRTVGLQIQPKDCSVLLLFWYDPNDIRTIVRLLPKYVEILDSSGLFSAEDERLKNVKYSLKEMQDINCNSLVLHHVCRTAFELFHTS